MNRTDPETLLKRVRNSIHNNPLTVGSILIVTVVVGLAAFTDAVDKLRLFAGSDDTAAKAEYCELLVPLIVQFDRTKSAFARWTDKNLSLESPEGYPFPKEAEERFRARAIELRTSLGEEPCR